MRLVDKALDEARASRLVKSEFIGAQRVPKRREAGLGLLWRDAGLEACNQREPNGLVIGEVIQRSPPRQDNLDHADRNEDAGAIAADGRIEVLRSDAEDGEWMTVDQDSLADDVSGRAETG